MPNENNEKESKFKVREAKPADPKVFQVGLKNSGTDTSYQSSIVMYKNKDANILLSDVIKVMALRFLKDGKDAATLICQLACNIIKEFKPEDIDLKDWFEKVIKMDHWILK